MADDISPCLKWNGKPIRKLSPALQKIAEDELGEVPSRVLDDINAIKEWLAKQQHITANEDDQWILAFLRGSKFSLERTKEKLENYYTAKTLSPGYFIGMDPADEKFLKFFRQGACVALKGPVSENGAHLIISRPGLYSAKEYEVHHNMQVTYMISEILMLESDNMNVRGLEMVTDMENVTMSHVGQFTPTIAKKLAVFSQKSMPIRQRGAHIVNSPPGVETALNVFKNFLSEKLKNRMFVHNKNFEQLYKHIPKKSLPKEYGGDAGSMVDLVEFWEKKLLSYRNYFLAAQDYKTDESLRLGNPMTEEDLYGVVGSFRVLNVD